jgi:UDP-4-amino-4,6-dideoxy-N-acetyl-beta-L-altrosamine transaminase
MTNIPYGRQDIDEADINAVVEVLRSDFLTQGPVVPRFERAVAEYSGVDHALAMNSATSALHIACLALGLGPGDWLWTSPITFVASANCALYCGAQVDFVDVDRHTYNMSPQALERKLVQAEREGRLPKIVVAVHLCGQPCELAAIHTLGKRYGFSIIEDASHAIGGRYQNGPIGDCRYSDVTVFSFHPVKIITSGEGGMAVTNNAELASRMSLLRSHGITRDPALMTHEPDGPWYYQQVDLGYNYRMTELQGALGLSQMARVDAYVGRRHELARRYDLMLKEFPVTIPWQHPDGYSGLHLYVIRLQLDAIKGSHKDVFKSMQAQGIGVNLHYIPVHMQPYYQSMGFKRGDYPEAEAYYSEAMTIPMYPTMTYDQQDSVISALKKALVK